MNRLLFVFISICYVSSLTAQTVGEVLEIRDASQYNWDLLPGDVVRDEQGNYYYYQLQYANSSDPDHISDGGINFNDINVERGPILDTISQYNYFVYLLKFSPDFELLASNIIMNVNRVENISVNHGYFSIVVSLDDYVPLIVGDTVYQSSKMYPEGWVLVFNDNLEREKVIHFPSNSVKSAYLGKDTGEIFIGLQINELSKYIVLAGDTIWNYRDTILPGIEYSPYTGVIASYNYLEDNYSWMRKFGDVWGGSLIKQVKVDPFGDVLVMGLAGADSYVYLDDQLDSLPSTGINITRQDVAESVMLKFSPGGDYKWGVTTPEAKWEAFREMSVDIEGNIYIRAHHENDSLEFRGNILGSRGDRLTGFGGRSLLAKFNRDGTFEWVHQLEGSYNKSIYFNVNASQSDFIYVSGIFRYGNIEIGDSLIDYDSSLAGTYNLTFKIDKDGNNEHLMYQSLGSKALISDILAHDNEDVTIIIRTEPDVEIYGLEYGDPDRVLFVKVDLNELVNSNNEIQNEEIVSIFPNPIRRGGRLHIQLDSKLKNQYIQLRVYSLDGREVLVEELNTYSKNIELTIPNELSQSAYLLRLEGKEVAITQTLIIK